MLDSVRVICDPERFGSDVLVHCPEHAQKSAWFGETLAAWHWVRRGRPLRDFVKRPSAWLFDAIGVLDAAWGGLDIELQKFAQENPGQAAGAGK